jgi:hypothetical protein
VFVLRRLRHAPRAGLAVTAILAVPLFFAALMATSLAIEKPQIHAQWRNGKGTLISVYGPPAAWLEAKIWLLSVAVVVIVALAATAAMVVRAGVVPVGLAAIAVSAAILTRLDTWTVHHTARFPYGADLIRDTSVSNILLQGEWEQSAHATAVDLLWVTIGFGLAAIAVVALLSFRRRRAAETGRPLPPDATGGPEIAPSPHLGP